MTALSFIPACEALAVRLVPWNRAFGDRWRGGVLVQMNEKKSH